MTLPKSQKLSRDEMCEAFRVVNRKYLNSDLPDTAYVWRYPIFSYEWDLFLVRKIIKQEVMNWWLEMHDLYGDDSE